MKTKKIGVLLTLMMFLGGGLVLGEVGVSKAADPCSKYEGNSGGIEGEGTVTAKCERIKQSADWWCTGADDDCENDDDVVDHRFCDPDGNPSILGIICRDHIPSNDCFDEPWGGSACSTWDIKETVCSSKCEDGLEYAGTCVPIYSGNPDDGCVKGAGAVCSHSSTGVCNTTCCEDPKTCVDEVCVAAVTCTEDTCNLSTQKICDADGNWVTTGYCAKCDHCGDGVKNCGEACDTNGNIGCGVDEICDSCGSCNAAAGSCEGEVQQNVKGDKSTISLTFHGTAGKNFNMGFLDPTGDHYVTSYADGEKLIAYAEVKGPPDCVSCEAKICVYSPRGGLSSKSLSGGESKSVKKSSPASGEWTYVLQYKKDGTSPSCPADPDDCGGVECCLTKVTVAACIDNCDGNAGCQSGIPGGMHAYAGANKSCCDGKSCCELDAAPPPVPPCDSLDCGAVVTNANCMCGLQLVSVNGDYCCAADNYYGDNATCIAKCGAVPPGPVPPGPGPGPADPCGLGTGELCNPLADRTTGAGWGSISDIAEGMLNYLLGLVGSIALLFLIIAGVMYMTAGGNEEKITTAKKILTGAVIGLAIVLLAYSLLAEISDILKIKNP